MMTTGDMANTIAIKCKEFGIREVVQGDCIPETGEIKDERIVIIPKQRSNGRIWNSTPVEVNILTPNLRNSIINAKRLNEIEHMAMGIFSHRQTGEHDGTPYRYTFTSIGRINSATLRCGWINVKISFETLNTK